MKRGIRRRLITLFISATAIEWLLMVFVSLAIWISASVITDSYSSNLKVRSYTESVRLLMHNLDSCMKFKSYDNIDSYLRNKAALERMSLELYKNPGHSENLLAEYTVFKFTVSFINYADEAVFKKWQGDSASAVENYEYAQKAYVFLEKSIEKLNSIFFRENITRYGLIQATMRQMTFSTGLITSVISLVVAFLLTFFVSSITQPLTEISETANKLAERNFDIPLFTYSEKDEIGNICRAFNKMIISIREYIDTIWEKALKENELREKEMKMMELYQDAKLTALQSQINPHFLFNTLNTGAQLAMMEGSDRTCDFLEKVAEFYRYNLQFTGKDSVLSDEIKVIESYIYIMKVRFGNHFDFFTDIRTSRLNVPLPGMILQPLVENCIKHGLSKMETGGKICFSVYEEGDSVVISVADNGIGFPEEKRNELLTGISKKPAESVVKLDVYDSGTGVGLVNVISRLRMFFKSNDVFDIQQTKGGGTTFIIRINNVQHIAY